MHNQAMPGSKQDLTPIGDTREIHHGRMHYDAMPGSTSTNFMSMRIPHEQNLGHDLTPSGALQPTQMHGQQQFAYM